VQKEESEAEEDEDEYLTADEEDDEGESDLQKLVDNLPLAMRTKIRSKTPIVESEEEEEEEDEDAAQRWGKKKEYWTRDTADLEIGQEFADAEDEEEAAQELHKQKLKRLSTKDYQDDLDGSDDDDGDESTNKQQQKRKKSTDKVAKELEAIALAHGSGGEMDALQVEKLTKDVSKMSKQQKIDLIAEQSPELLTIVRELRERVEELQTRVSPVKHVVAVALELNMKVDDDLVDYLDVKQQLLLAYCTNVVFYLYMKSLGKSVRTHPVMRQLLRLRYCIEKLQGLDAKLKHQIDRLVKLSEAKSDEIKAGLLRPNLTAFLNDDEEEDGEEVGDRKGQKAVSQTKSKTSKKKNVADSEDEEVSQEEEDEDRQQKKIDTYRPKKLTAVPYPVRLFVIFVVAVVTVLFS
jgi:U3 small nucleolar RNA-associated protein 3